MDTSDASKIGQTIARDPNLRLKFLESPESAARSLLPSSLLGLRSAPTADVALVVQEAVDAMQKDPDAVAALRAEGVKGQFFADAMQNPQRSFLAQLTISGGAFIMGVALIIVSMVLALGSPDTTETVLAGLFGGVGTLEALATVTLLARSGVATANANNAQLRLILAGYSTELGHLRTLDQQSLTPDELVGLNEQIRTATQRAVELVQHNVKVPQGALASGSDTVDPNGDEDDDDDA